MSLEKATINIEGIAVPYLFREGKSMPCFFVHGWGGEKDSWRSLIEEMGDKFEVYAMDLPGFGECQEPGEVWKLEDYSDFVINFIDKIREKHEFSSRHPSETGGVVAYNIIVHSFGGRILFKGVSKFKNVKKAVLIATAGIKHPLSMRARLGQKIAAIGKAFLKFPLFKPIEKTARKSLYKLIGAHDYEKTDGIMRKIFLNVIAEDLKPEIESLKTPACIIWGKNDGFVPVADAYYMNKVLLNSQLHIIENGRHGIHKTHAKMVADWIKNFLNK